MKNDARKQNLSERYIVTSMVGGGYVIGWMFFNKDEGVDVMRQVASIIADSTSICVEATAEIERLRALLLRHDDLCRKVETGDNDYVWTPELEELVSDTRAALGTSEQK